MLIFKICEYFHWSDACEGGNFNGSADDRRDGFIHLSTAEQLRGTLEKHFAGADNLVVIAYDDTIFGDELRWEPSRGGELFPHVYGSLDPRQARWVKPLPLGPDGHILPELEII
jgi:uncharacterized protein (DUF952 family)